MKVISVAFLSDFQKNEDAVNEVQPRHAIYDFAEVFPQARRDARARESRIPRSQDLIGVLIRGRGRERKERIIQRREALTARARVIATAYSAARGIFNLALRHVTPRCCLLFMADAPARTRVFTLVVPRCNTLTCKPPIRDVSIGGLAKARSSSGD